MPLHCVHVDRGQQIIDKRDVFIPELTTIHQMTRDWGRNLRLSVPAVPRAVPEYARRRVVGRFAERKRAETDVSVPALIVRWSRSVDLRFDDRRKGIPGAVQT